jgi:large subunit ribosomal protein L21
MYAVIKTGGKQHKVQTGDVIEVEKIVQEGETMTFQPLLVVDDDGKTHVGAEAAKATVTAKPLGEKKGEKVKIFKYRPKSGYAQRGGHRQLITLLEIEDVKLGGSQKSEKKAEKKSEKKTEPKAEKKSAPKAEKAEKSSSKAEEAPAEDPKAEAAGDEAAG